MEEREGYGVGSMFFAFLLGGLVGAGVALILAPQSGPETRKRVRDLAEDVKEKTSGIKEKVSKGVEQGKDVVSATIAKGKEFVDEQKSALGSAIEAGKEAFEQERERHKKA
ncbi:MAG TPA: YtxH domain-containing protein [Nitrospirae bacterium]|nr:YtxH domain-containing protein [Nitrospirota bacterium]